MTLLKTLTAPLLAAYAGSCVVDWPNPATEQILIIDPPPARLISGIACFAPRKTPLELTA